jgi:hypothetical protein
VTAPLADRVLALVGHIVDPPAACPSPTHTTPQECPAFRALAVHVLTVADQLDRRATALQALPTPNGPPAAAAAVERADRATDLIHAADDLRGAIKAATAGHIQGNRR